ncbi:hypothetical protein ABQF35_18350 [Mycobacterium syngnathidarum]
MAASLDVAARLDEGQAAVDTISEYVWACHLLGFDHPDLTRYRYQVRDWYAAEDGLDLRALDAECVALSSVAATAEQILRLQDNHFQELSQAWQGAGARASTDFLARHATSAAQVSAGILGAAGILTRLRDNLWEAVDAKVSAAMQIEERQDGQRGIWLAAARTVSGGMGDRSAASELIDAQVKPFVANDIGGDWLTAMRNTTRAVADAYRQALAALRAEALPVFGIPGELGPAWGAPVLARAAGITAGSSMPEFTNVGASGPAWSATPAVMPAATAAAPVPMSAPSPGAEPMGVAAQPVGSAPGAPTAPSGLGQGLGGGGLPGLGGLPDVGSGLTGAGQQLADLFGGLLGSSADGVADPIGDVPEDDAADDPGEGDTSEEDTSEEDTESDEDDGADPDGAEAVEPQPESAPATVAPVDAEVPALAPTTTPEPATPVTEPLAAATGGTPCEIAADELPQAGG